MLERMLQIAACHVLSGLAVVFYRQHERPAINTSCLPVMLLPARLYILIFDHCTSSAVSSCIMWQGVLLRGCLT